MSDEMESQTLAMNPFLEDMPTPEDLHNLEEPILHRRRRGRPRKMPDDAREQQLQRNEESRAMDYDEWIQRWDWNEPGMRSVVKRLSPSHVPGVAYPLNGRLESRESLPYTSEEVSERWGGGRYEVLVSGPSPNGIGNVSLGRKQLEVAGPPKILPPEHVADKLAQMASATSSGPFVNPYATQSHSALGIEHVAPQAQGALVGLVGKQFEHMMQQIKDNKSGNGNHNLDASMLKDTSDRIEKAWQQQSEAIKQAADAQNSVLRTQLEDLRQEASRLRAEQHAYQKQSVTEVSNARDKANDFVVQLLPTMSAQAQEQVTRALTQAEGHVQRMAEQYRRDLESERRIIEQQLQNMRSVYDAAQLNLRTTYEAQIAQLRSDIGVRDARLVSIEADNQRLRDTLLDTQSRHAKANSPLGVLTEHAQIIDAARKLTGGGNDGEGDEEKGLIGQVLPLLNNITEIARARFGGGGGGNEAVAPQPPAPQPPQQRFLPQRPLQFQPQVNPQQQQPQQPQQPQPQQQPQPERVQIRREDLELATRLLASAFEAKMSAKDAAHAAATQMDHGVLKALCRVPAERVVEVLQAKDLLAGALSTSEGMAYLIEVHAELGKYLT